MKHGVGIEI